jgi:hypothetical protein
MKFSIQIFFILCLNIFFWSCKKNENKESIVDYREKYCGNWFFTTIDGDSTGWGTWIPFDTIFYNGTISKSSLSDSIVDIQYDSIKPLGYYKINPKVNSNGSLSFIISGGFFKGYIDLKKLTQLDMVQGYYMSGGASYLQKTTGKKNKKYAANRVGGSASRS